VEFLHSVAFADIDITVAVDAKRGWIGELTVLRTVSAPLEDKAAIPVEFLDLVVATVDRIHVASRIAGDAYEFGKLRIS